MKNTKTLQNVHATFSIPQDIIALLHARVKKRHLSSYVSQAIKKALEEDYAMLKAAYAEASNDPHRLEILDDWESIECKGFDE